MDTDNLRWVFFFGPALYFYLGVIVLSCVSRQRPNSLFYIWDNVVHFISAFDKPTPYLITVTGWPIWLIASLVGRMRTCK